MTPKEKAEELVGKNYEMFINDEDEHYTKTAWRLSKQCALIAVDEMLNALDSFGYTGCMYDDFETGHILYTDDKDPSDYWQEVKQEIEKL